MTVVVDASAHVAANLHLLTDMLVGRGYRVRPVTSGRAALQAARSEPPDLILLDIRMPEMSGFEVCERLKADDALNPIPVIFLSGTEIIRFSGKVPPEPLVRFIIKPPDFAHIREAITDLLGEGV